MNDLKNKETASKVKEYIAIDIKNLYFAYSQPIEKEELNKIIKFIISNLENRYRLNKNLLDATYNEVINNYTNYRKMTPSTYLTAYTKKTQL